MRWNDFIIGQNVLVSGDLKSISNIYINGQIEGSAQSDSNIVIHNSGVVKGRLGGVELEVSGTIEGEAQAKKIHITPTGKFLGNLATSVLRIDEDASFIGCSKRINHHTDSRLKNTDPVYEV